MSNANGAATGNDATVSTEAPEDSDEARVEIGDWILTAASDKELADTIDAKLEAARRKRKDAEAEVEHWTAVRTAAKKQRR